MSHFSMKTLVRSLDKVTATYDRSLVSCRFKHFWIFLQESWPQLYLRFDCKIKLLWCAQMSKEYDGNRFSSIHDFLSFAIFELYCICKPCANAQCAVSSVVADCQSLFKLLLLSAYIAIQT